MQRAWLRAVTAAAVSTAAVAVWRWVADPVPGEGTLLPWSVLGLLVAAATVVGDRLTAPFAGVATTATGAGLAVALTGTRDASAVADGVVCAVGVALLAAGVSGVLLLHDRLAPSRRPWARGVLALGGAAWLFPLGWWPLRDDEPADAELLLAVAAGTLVVATVVGGRTIGRWWGALFALPPAALLAAAPLAASDSLGLVVWGALTVAGALTCLAGVGALVVVQAGVRAAGRTARPPA